MPRLVPLTDFVQAPLGGATASERAVFWFARPELRLVSIWGTPRDADASFLMGAMATEIREDAARHASYVDLRDFDDVSAEVFQTFLGYMRQHRAQFSRAVTKSAIVASERMSSAAALGYTRLLGDPFPSQVFDRGEDALAWLGFGAEAQSLLTDLSSLVQQVRDSTVVARLRDMWRSDLRQTRIADAARALGLSTRLLQRQLAAAGTTFRDELRRARVERAKVLLRDTDEKLFGVATEVGFEKAASLIDAFKRETGLTPESWRTAARMARSGND